MKNIINKFLLTGEKFIPEMHLKQLRFRYNAYYNAFTKKKMYIYIYRYKSSKQQETLGISTGMN